MVEQRQFDIVILGSGLVGLATARALPEHLRARTLLIDTQPLPDFEHPPHFRNGARTTALNRRTLDLLDAWDCPSLGDAGQIRTIEVSQQGYWGTSLINADAKAPSLGSVVANTALQQSLYASLTAQHSPTFRYQVEITHLEFTADAVKISLSDDSTYNAALLILADGGASPWGARCGLQWREKDYHQVAFTLNIQRQQPTSHIAYERFTEQGSRALLPLGGRWQTVVWVVDAKEAPAITTWHANDWRTAIMRCFGYQDGCIEVCSTPLSYPLKSRFVSEQARSRLAVVGNGALTLHPIAGQGFNLHCRTVFELGQVLGCTDDPGSWATLQQWQNRVQSDQQQIATACDGLLTLFQSWHPSLAHVRGLGLQTFNGLPWVPNWLTRRAMGFL